MGRKLREMIICSRTMKPRLHSASLQYRQIFLQQFPSMSLLQSNAMVILFVQGGYAITNTGSEIFHVSDIRVTMLDAAYSFVESDENLQDRQIYLTMTGTNPSIAGPVSDTVTFVSGNDDKKQSFGTEPTTYNTWNVDQGGKIEFEFKGKLNGISAKWAEKQELFTIAYTIEPGEIYGPNPKG